MQAHIKSTIILFYKRSVEFILTPFLIIAILFSIIRYCFKKSLSLKPNIFLGPTHIINHLSLEKAAKLFGYKSKTFSFAKDRISGDISILFSIKSDITEPWLRMAAFIYCVTNYDIILDYFTNKFLQNTYLAASELFLLKLAQKKIVLLPFGSDIAAAGFLGPWEEALIAENPGILKKSEATQKRVMHLTRYSDCIIKTYQPGFMPFYDVLAPIILSIDMSLFPKKSKIAQTPNQNIVILHATNHRKPKKSDDIIAAVTALKQEGFPIEFIFLEKASHPQVQDALQKADIVVDQLILGYGMFAIEAMASSCVVLSNMDYFNQLFMHTDVAKACPILNTNTDNIKDNLIKLIQNPDLLIEYKLKSYDFVERFHALASLGKMYDHIYRYVWDKIPLPHQFTENVNPFRQRAQQCNI